MQRSTAARVLAGALAAAAVVAGTLTLTGPVRAAHHQDRDAGVPSGLPTESIQAILDELVASDVLTAALIRVDDGDAHWASGAGVQDLASGKPVHADGHFRIGSATKSFTATVVLQLVDEGKLGLDDPIQRHLPGVVPDGDAITVRQLLNHTSGIFDWAGVEGYSSMEYRGAGRTISPQELLEVAFAQQPYFPPGAGWHYSNTNYTILGLLIEQLTGSTYAQQVQRRILRPLHLRDTVVPGSDPTIPDPHAHGYAPLVGDDGTPGALADATEINQSKEFAAGDIISTTADLNRLFDALLSGELTSQRSLAAMRTTVDSTLPGQRYGLGLIQTRLPCGKSAWGHDGGMVGFITYSMHTDDGRQVTISANPYTAQPPPDAQAKLISKIFCQT